MFFYLVDLWPVIITTFMQNLKIVCQGEVCKIHKPSSLFIKTLTKLTPRKMENEIFFFRSEILATNIGQGQILKNICQQLCLSQFQLDTSPPGNLQGLAQKYCLGGQDLTFESFSGAMNSTRAGILWKMKVNVIFIVLIEYQSWSI